jgi:hypothetical protein
MATEPHREFCRRQHRVLGHYLSLESWRRGLECIVLTRKDLEAFLGLERFKKERVKWFLADLQPWFPHQVRHNSTKAPSSFHSVYLSRVPIEEHLPSGSMSVEKRIALMAADAPKTKLFLSDDVTHRPSEGEIVSRLARLAAGLEAP